jgi:hypothetical protein
MKKGQRTLSFTQATFGGPMISNASPLPDQALKDLLKARRGAPSPAPSRSRAFNQANLAGAVERQRSITRVMITGKGGRP